MSRDKPRLWHIANHVPVSQSLCFYYIYLYLPQFFSCVSRVILLQFDMEASQDNLSEISTEQLTSFDCSQPDDCHRLASLDPQFFQGRLLTDAAATNSGGNNSYAPLLARWIRLCPHRRVCMMT